MAREPKVLDEEVDYLGPVAIAMFVELGWIRLWPMTWTKGGLRGLQRGYGRWDGVFQQLPDGYARIEPGAAHWDHRRPRVPAGTYIPLAWDQRDSDARSHPRRAVGLA